MVYIQISHTFVTRFVLFCLLTAVLLAQTSGCAHEPQSLPRNVFGSVQSLGILALEAEPDMSVTAPTAGRVAAGGATDGANLVPSCSGDALCVVLIPLELLFAGAGAVVGASTAESKEKIATARDAIETAITEMMGASYLAQRVQQRFQSEVRAPTILLYGSEMPHRDEGIYYQRLTDFAVDTVLEIRSAFLRLRSGFTADPSVSIEIVVQTRLVSVPDGTVIVNRTFDHDNLCEYPRCRVQTDIEDPSHTFFALAKDDAALLREFFDQASTTLSNEIISFYKPAVRYHRYYKPY